MRLAPPIAVTGFIVVAAITVITVRTSPTARAAVQERTALLVPASSPVAPPAPFSVEEAVRLAVSVNPRLAAAARDVGAAASGVRSAAALTNPNVVVAPAITSVSGSSDEFVAQQALEVNGTRVARTGVAQAELRGTRAQAVVTLRDVVFSTKSAYFELARAREQAAVARDARAVAQEFDRIARRQVEEGVRPGIDLAQTGLEVSRAERQVTLAAGQETAALAALNTVLGRMPAAPVGVLTSLVSTDTAPGAAEVNPTPPTPAPSGADGADGVDGEAAALAQRALSARAEVEAEEAARERFRQEGRLARAEGRPDLAPQFRVGSFTRGLQPSASGNGAGIGIGITLPLLDWGSRRDRIRQSEQSARAQDARIAAVRNEIARDVAQALARRRAADAVVLAYRDGGGAIEQARRLLEGSRTGFREGRTSVVSLLEAQRSYRAVESEYVNALADAAVARAELERAVGAVPPSLVPASDR